MKLIAAIAVCVFLIWLDCLPARATPIFVVDEGGVNVSLTDEPCAVDAVTNLPYRAVWKDGAQIFEGCYGLTSGVVVMYFDGDRTVAIAPLSGFKRVRSI